MAAGASIFQCDTKRVANDEEQAVLVPTVLGVVPVQVQLAAVIVPVQVRDVTVAVGVHPGGTDSFLRNRVFATAP